jgi:hypothetical protein
MLNHFLPKFMFKPNSDQLNALRAAKTFWGRNWKQELGNRWLVSRYPDSLDECICFLQQVRNQGGPSFLQRFRLPKA